MVKNVDYDKINIDVVQGDTLDLTFSLWRNGSLYDLTGARIDMEVKDNKDELITTLTSQYPTPSIMINAATFRLYKEDFISIVGRYNYDIQITEGTKVSTVCRGKIRVTKEITD